MKDNIELGQIWKQTTPLLQSDSIIYYMVLEKIINTELYIVGYAYIAITDGTVTPPKRVKTIASIFLDGTTLVSEDEASKIRALFL